MPIFTRSEWKGETRFSSYRSNKYKAEVERIVMIQAFHSTTGRRLPYFKAAYLDEDNNVRLKLAFAHDPERVGGKEDIETESFEMRSTVEFPRRGHVFEPNVGSLSASYAVPCKGAITAWTYRINELFQTWHYKNFWGLPTEDKFGEYSSLENVTEPNPYPILFVDGKGHVGVMEKNGKPVGQPTLVRTMTYYAADGLDRTPLYLKSSVLQRTGKPKISNKEIELFI